MKVLRLTLLVVSRSLTILAGAVPATYVCFFAYLVAMLGFVALMSGYAVGLVLILWALAGFYGTLSLWAVGFGFIRGWSVAGLLLGTIALFPIAGPFLTGDTLKGLYQDPDTIVFVSPIVVAVSWLVVIVVRSFLEPIRKRDAVNDVEHA